MQGKSAAGSVTIVSAVVILLAQLAQVAGYAVSEDDQQRLVELVNSGVLAITTIVSIAGGIGAIYGRIRAERPIVSVLPQKKNVSP